MKFLQKRIRGRNRLEINLLHVDEHDDEDSEVRRRRPHERAVPVVNELFIDLSDLVNAELAQVQ